jgi:hypothetical protein
MASRLAIRQPLTERNINTTAYNPQPQPTSTPVTTPSSANGHTSSSVSHGILKPTSLTAGHKRTHSQITSGQENTPVQQQIRHSAVTFKEPALPPPQRQILVTVTPTSTKRPQPQRQPAKVPVTGQFKQPVKTAGVVVSRQRQETHDPGVRHAQQTDQEAEELEQWRRYMKRTISTATFYFDGIEENLKEQASRWLFRHGGVNSPNQPGCCSLGLT